MQTERLLNEIPSKQASLFADSPLEVSSNASSQTLPQRSSDSLDHLAAAQRLAKKLRNGRRKPRTSKRAGIAICQHLIALLQEGETREGERHEGGAQQRGMFRKKNAESRRSI